MMASASISSTAYQAKILEAEKRRETTWDSAQAAKSPYRYPEKGMSLVSVIEAEMCSVINGFGAREVSELYFRYKSDIFLWDQIHASDPEALPCPYRGMSFSPKPVSEEDVCQKYADYLVRVAKQETGGSVPLAAKTPQVAHTVARPETRGQPANLRDPPSLEAGQKLWDELSPRIGGFEGCGPWVLPMGKMSQKEVEAIKDECYSTLPHRAVRLYPSFDERTGEASLILAFASVDPRSQGSPHRAILVQTWATLVEWKRACAEKEERGQVPMSLPSYLAWSVGQELRRLTNPTMWQMQSSHETPGTAYDAGIKKPGKTAVQTVLDEGGRNFRG